MIPSVMNLIKMRRFLVASLMAACSLALSANQRPPQPEAGPPTEAQLDRVRTTYAELAKELGSLCPIAGPEDVVAFDKCRQALYGDSLLRRQLPRILLWGRARGVSLKETPLTQFAPDVYAGLYAPLFMFEGSAAVVYDTDEKLIRATLPVRFRNRLAPGQFPYPFWHDKTKWGAYQSASAVVFYIDAATMKIKVAQFVPGPQSEAITAQAESQAAAFDGKWLWTDKAGHTQPQVTLFDGLYDRRNPYLGKIDTAYRALALEMREGECDTCHVPDNPQKMKRLVLLQTPAHAAGEIKRVLRAVREGSMPEDDFGIEKSLPPEIKARLLKRVEAFDALLTQAQTWEAQHVVARP
ncbi:MAG: hypothetical protein ACT4PZ_03380 [Panacagrimonas sp.]